MNNPTVVEYRPGLRDEHEVLPDRFEQIILEKANKDYWCLDLGTGRGKVAFFLADKVRWILGLDNRSEPIEEARRRAQNEGIVNIQFMVADVEQTLLAEMSPIGHFQLVTSNLFLSEKTIELCREAVAPKGFLVCTCFAENHWQEAGKISKFAFTEKQLKELLHSNGFTLEEFHTFEKEYRFDDIDQLRSFLPRVVMNRWQDNGRWACLEQNFGKGKKQLTDSRFLFVATRP